MSDIIARFVPAPGCSDLCKCGHPIRDHSCAPGSFGDCPKCFCRYPDSFLDSAPPEEEAEYVSPVFAILDSILALNADERLIFLDELRANVCLHCGNPDPRCQCSNDE